MEALAVARAIHVLAVVLWIGGVAVVTTVLLPAIYRFKAPSERLQFFGISGFYMLDRLDLWYRFRSVEYWWRHAMVCVWLLFTAILFVAEPLFPHRWLLARATVSPQSTFSLIQRLHWVLLILSAITILGAVAGSHGLVLSG